MRPWFARTIDPYALKIPAPQLVDAAFLPGGIRKLCSCRESRIGPFGRSLPLRPIGERHQGIGKSKDTFIPVLLISAVVPAAILGVRPGFGKLVGRSVCDSR